MADKIATELAPKAIGPYAQGVKSQDYIFVSGQLPIDSQTQKIVEGIGTQTEQSIKNIKVILEAAKVTLNNVVKTTCYLTRMEDFAEFNAVYEKYFTAKPARSCVVVKELPKGARCEIEVIAEVI